MKNYFGFMIVGIAIFFTWLNHEQTTPLHSYSTSFIETPLLPELNDTTPPDTGLLYPLPQDDPTEFFPPETAPIHLANPGVIKDTIIYDSETNEYVYYRKVGDFLYRLPQSLSFEE